MSKLENRVNEVIGRRLMRQIPIDPENGGPRPYPEYSKDLTLAMSVVSHLRDSGFHVVMGVQLNGCSCRIYRPEVEEQRPDYQTAATLPMAICLAALNCIRVTDPY